MEDTTKNGNGSRRDATVTILKEALGGGESVGSKLSGLGVILAAIWLILEYQSGFSQDEFKRLHDEIVRNRHIVSEQADLRRERLQSQLQQSDADLRHEISDLRLQIDQNGKDCEKRFQAIEQAIHLKG